MLYVIRCEKEPLGQNAVWCLLTWRKSLLMQKNISKGLKSLIHGLTRTTNSLFKMGKDSFIVYVSLKLSVFL